MKNILQGVIWILALSGVRAFADVVDFTGAYAPGNWVVSGTGATSTGVAQITVTGSDNQSGLESYTSFMIVPGFPSLISFNWSYTSSDTAPDLDPAGYQVGNQSFPLTNIVGFDLQQSGSVGSILLPAGETFGFWVKTTDNMGGAASLTISDFTAITASPSPVPEPSTYAMVGLAAAATVLRKRFVASAK